MYPEKVREKDCPPMTTFHLIMKTPKMTRTRARMDLRIVSPGISRRMKGTRFPRVYWRMKILVKSFP
jgi:hypothetical protein